MQSLRQLLSGLRSRPKAHLAIALVAVANHVSVVGLAAAPALGAVAISGAPITASCSHITGQGQCSSPGTDTLQLSVPAGAEACPNSGQAVTCGRSAADQADAGAASTPDGSPVCAANQASGSGVAACSDVVLQEPSSPAGSKGGSAAGPIVLPSVPDPTPMDTSVRNIRLVTDHDVATPAHSVVLTATADATVTGTGSAISIFDVTTGMLVGQCSQGSQCAVAFAAHSGVHTFEAFVSAPTSTAPSGSTAVASNQIDVNWIGVTFSATTTIVGPGQRVTVTATSTIPMEKTGWLLQIYDAESRSRLTYCASGNTCTTTLTQPVGGTRSFVATVSKPAPSLAAADHVLASTESLKVTWLSAWITAVATSASPGGTVHIVATANADLTNTPWTMGILNDHNQLVAPVCKSGSSCIADVAVGDWLPSFKAVIGLVPQSSGALGQLLQKVAGPSKLANVQAESSLVKPTVNSFRMLWGVDSCKSFTDDGLLSSIQGTLGSPDFWGRYLTDAVCPPLSSTEVAAAHASHMGILPIYNERDCSNVAGYDTGLQYAAEAVAAAKAIGLPEGRGIAIDIEPAGPACPGAANLDTGLIHGWYDGIVWAHYSPIFYANTTPGSEFATQWCYTSDSLPYIGQTSYLWSFQPSLLGGYMKSNAPSFGPNLTGCLGYVHGWQYQIGSSSWAAPDVDQDQITSEMPIWYP